MNLRTLLPALGLFVAAAMMTGCGGGDADTGAVDQPADVGDAGAADAGLAELQDYEMSMEGLNQWAEANRALQRLVTENPEVAMELEGEDSGDTTMEQSLDALEERIMGVPEAREAVEDAGLSVREYGLITYAMLQAGMAKYLVDQGADPDSVSQELEVSPENIRFVQEHEAEIEQLQAEMQAWSEE